MLRLAKLGLFITYCLLWWIWYEGVDYFIIGLGRNYLIPLSDRIGVLLVIGVFPALCLLAPLVVIYREIKK